MQVSTSTASSSSPSAAFAKTSQTASAPGVLAHYQIIRRNGAVVPFEPQKIAVAMMKAFLAVHGTQGAASASVREVVDNLTQGVVRALMRSRPGGGTFPIEDVQDQVELGLMRSGHHEIARAYVLYRERRAQERASQVAQAKPAAPTLHVIDGGQRVALDEGYLRSLIEAACEGLNGDVQAEPIFTETMRNLYDGVPMEEVYKASILAARTKIEKDPDYTYATARLLLHTIAKEVLGREVTLSELATSYVDYFPQFIKKGVENDLLDERLMQFDLVRLGAALKPQRDMQFDYLGLQTLYDRYFLHVRKTRIELPQAFFMRVAMGLSLNEIDREARAIEFYEVLSSFDFMSSTPTLFNSGTLRSQLSSCYLTTVPDDLDGIYESIKENALLSKFAGGLGNDWSRVRALGSHIKGTNGESQGVVPFLKVVNDTAVAVNQGGKRKGAMCAYLETWHLDIEDFLELRKNVGDERRRTHDMNTANWIPDLFMKRVKENGQWTLFSPSDVKDLHDLYGRAFEERYSEYEAMADRGEIELFKRVEATSIWRKILSMVFETGHPWITFKDPSNVRSPQDHQGVVHSSNLCTEILLNTSAEETAVCNLGSIGLPLHINEKGLDLQLLEKTVRTALRMLDNVIDINYYPTPEARNANLRHRPVGLGLMGFQDALYKLKISYASNEAVTFADTSMEAISYFAILASTELAAERGAYQTYKGSKWDRGLLPIDTIDLLEQERGLPVSMDRSSTMDWNVVRTAVLKHGMRNSNTMAIAPTATISNITGVSQSIEPTFKNLFAKENLSGGFTVINSYLVEDLKALGIWDRKMLEELKYKDGSILGIDRIPEKIREIYRTAFEIEPHWYIECASRRQKWIDMGQSLNLYIAAPSGKRLNDMYLHAWETGLKTTYYLRATAASTVEQSTSQSRPNWVNQPSKTKEKEFTAEEAAACSIEAMRNGGECEACQ